MKIKRTIAIILSVMIVAAAFAGCSNKSNSESQSEGAKVILNGDEIYPVSCEDTVSFWMPLNAQIATDYANFGETPLGKALEERTGIKVEYIHPEGGSVTEQFSVMLASNELPDIIQYNMTTYPGGPDRAIEEEVIINLADVFDYMPALSNILKKDNAFDKKVKTDSSNYYCAPFAREASWMTSYQGLIIRADWLKECGLEIPNTIDDLETVLKAFKDKYDIIPLAMASYHVPFIMYAYGIAPDFYLDGNELKYGYAQSKYKEVLSKIKQWIDEGLLDPDIATLNDSDLNSKMLNEKTGVIFGACGGGIETILDSVSDSNSKGFDLIAGPCLTLDGKQPAEYAAGDDVVLNAYGTSISTNCKNYELAARFLDYGYTDEGHMLYNFGIEGESYNMVDGKPVFTDLVTNNPEGASFTNVVTRYTRASYNGPFIHNEEYLKQSFVYPKQQLDAYQKWGNNNMQSHRLPPVTFKTEEIDDAADIQANLNTYVHEMKLKFIVGSEPLENFDSYLKQLEAFELSKLSKMYESAVDRYNKR